MSNCKLWRIWLSSLFVLIVAFVPASLFAPLAIAQSNPNEAQGNKPYGSTHGSDIDDVSLTDGSVTLQIPLASFPQRGDLSLSFFVRYSSKEWIIRPARTSPTTGAVISSAAWAPFRGSSGAEVVSSVDWRVQTTNTTGANPDSPSSVAVTSPDGNLHQLGGGSGSVLFPTYSLDATGLFYHDINTLIQPNGTIYKYTNVPSNSAGQLSSAFAKGVQPSSVTDTNGNQITIGSSGWTDTLGRVIPGSSSGTGQPTQPGVATTDLSNCPSGTVSANVWTIPGYNGGSRTFKFCYSNFTLSTSFNTTGVDYPATATPLLSAVILPDLSQWTLAYDNYGDLTRLGLPTGGAITYQYTTRAVTCQDSLNPSPTPVSRWVTSRTVDANDGNGGRTYNYNWGNGTVKVTDPAGNDTVHTISAIANASCSLYDTQTQYYQGSSTSGTLLKTVATQYTGATVDYLGPDFAVNVVPTQITTTLQGGKSSKVVRTYDSGTSFKEVNGAGVTASIPVVLGSVLQEDQYDFSNTLVQSTINHYIWQDNSTYMSNNLLSLVASSTVRAGSTMIGQKKYFYDETAPSATSSSVPGHVAVTTPRGNRTTVQQWRSISNSFLSTTNAYDDTGNIISTTDPLGHNTTNSFADNYSDGVNRNSLAFSTQTSDPDTASGANGATVHHVRNATYDFNTGLVASATDQNGNTTSYGYDAATLRPSTVTQPGTTSPTTTYSYPDFNTTTVQRSITSSLTDRATTQVDGLGRTIKAIHSTPNGDVTADMTYDSLGRVQTVSNPHFSSSSATDGITTTNYDALDRAIQVTKPDGSFMTADYSQGNCMVAVDEAGNPRRACSDAFGRLIEVDEPNVASAGTKATATVAIGGSLASVQNTSAVSARVTPLFLKSPGDVYYIDSNGHAHELFQRTNGTWGDADATAQASAPVASARSSIRAYLVNSTTYVFYVDGNGHVQALSSSGGTFTGTDVTAANKATNANLGTPLASRGAGEITYLDANGDVWEIYLHSDGTLGAGDLTSQAGGVAAAANSQLMTFVANGTTYILYEDSNGHIQTIACCTSAGALSHTDVTAATKATNAASGTPLASRGAGEVTYLDTSGHVWELYLHSDGTWGAPDLTGQSGAVAAATNSQVTTFIANGTTYILYEDANGHIQAISCCTSTGALSHTDVTAAASTIAAASGSPLFARNPGAVDWIDANGHVHELYANSSGTWGAPDATAQASAPVAAAGSQVTAWSVSGLTYVLHVDTNAHIQALSSNGGTFTGSDASVAGVSTFDSGTVSLAVGGFNATVPYGYGYSTNSNSNAVASALAAAFNNGATSPATASASGSTLSLIWKTAGPNEAVSNLTSAPNNPSQFPNGSFSGAQTSFTDGTTGTLDSTQYVTLYSYIYDSSGNLQQCVEQHGNAAASATNTGCSAAPGNDANSAWRIRRATFDSLGDLMSASNPETGAITYSYNDDGVLVSKTDARNITTNFSPSDSPIDALHRVTKKTYSNSDPAVTFSFDQGTNGIGRLTGMTDGAGSASYTFDALGRITNVGRTTNNVTKSIGYSYNLDGSIATITYPSNAVVTYTPDAAGRLLSAVDSGNSINYATSATYGATGLTGFVSGKTSTFNGITNSFSYNPRLQPITIAAGTPTQTLLSLTYDFHLGAGDNGNVYKVTNNLDSSLSQNFTYDSLNRLSSAQTSGTDCTQKLNGAGKFWGNSYSFDPWGNLLSKSVTNCSGYALSVVAGVNNRLTNGGYDAAGNLTSFGGANYAYDAESRLTGAGGQSYVYDARGNRVEKTNGSTGTIYWYGERGVVLETDLAGNTQKEYVFFGDKRIASKNASGTVNYYASDLLGSTNLMLDASGNVLNQSYFQPWGEEVQVAGSSSNNYKFTGKERDSESGLDYFGARYYSNALGRFATPDWSAMPVAVPFADLDNPQSLNLYSYVKNRPTALVDEDGHADDDKNKKKSGHKKIKTQTKINSDTITKKVNPDGTVTVTRTVSATETRTHKDGTTTVTNATIITSVTSGINGTVSATQQVTGSSTTVAPSAAATTVNFDTGVQSINATDGLQILTENADVRTLLGMQMIQNVLFSKDMNQLGGAYEKVADAINKERGVSDLHTFHAVFDFIVKTFLRH